MATADPWARPLFLPGGDDAFVFLVAFGADPGELVVSEQAHRVTGVARGIDIAVQDGGFVSALLEPPIGELLRETNPDAVTAASATDTCLIVCGEVTDPPDLSYLRSSIGLATAALDAGAVAIYNLQSMALFGAAEWRDAVFGPDVPPIHDLVVVLSSEVDETVDGQLWLHTRGLRMFGRPDLSLRGVPADRVDLGNRLLRVLIDQQVKGLLIEDGSSMELGDPIGAISFRRRGHNDDPEFNNVHLEIDWPSPTP